MSRNDKTQQQGSALVEAVLLIALIGLITITALKKQERATICNLALPACMMGRLGVLPGTDFGGPPGSFICWPGASALLVMKVGAETDAEAFTRRCNDANAGWIRNYIGVQE